MDESSDRAKRRLSILIQAAESGTVSDVCEKHGVSRTLFYRWRRRYKAAGIAGLEDQPAIARGHPCATPDTVRERVIACALRHPSLGCRDIAGQFGDPPISAVTVQKLLRQANLGTWRDRWLALERQLLSGVKLSIEQQRFISLCNPNLLYRSVASAKVAEVLFSGGFTIWYPGMQKRVHVAAIVDSRSGYAHGCISKARCELRTDKLFFEAANFYADQGMKIQKFLRLPDSYFDVSSLRPWAWQRRIEIVSMSCQPDALIQRFRRSLREAGISPFDSLFEKVQPSEDSFGDWLAQYNRAPQDGYPCNGRSPIQLLEGV